jgi:hypothetical protein
VLLVLAGVLVLAACGAGSSRLSKSEYEQKLNAEATSLQAAFGALDIQHNKNLDELATKVERLQAKVGQTANDIDKLNPPKDAEADTKKIAATLHRFADIFGELEDAARAGDRTKLLSAQQKLLAASQVGTEATNDLKQKGYDIGTFGG